MSELHIDTGPTRQFHERLAAALPTRRDEFAASLDAANQAMLKQRMLFGQQKPLEVALSALLLDASDVTRLKTFTESLCEVVEVVLATLLDQPELLGRHFPEHQRLFPYFARSRGIDSWQVVSRYDAAVTADGGLKIMELNTACPGAFLISEAVSLVTEHGFERIHQDLVDLEAMQIGSVVPRHLRDELLQIEAAAQIETGTIGILNDENGLTFELDHLVDAFRSRDREAVIVDARELQLRGDRLYHNDTYLSLVYNKFRISTPRSPNHCWRDGFESRYGAFLAAQQAGHVVSINNLVAYTIGEDKALLGLLHDEQLQQQMTPAQREFVEDHVLWTTRLAAARVRWRGETIDLLPYVQKHRAQFVIKPANEGRGFGVLVGRYCTDEQWTAACQVNPDVPHVVQEFAEAMSCPIICNRNGKVTAREMFLTLGLAVIAGKYQGLVSRVSTNPVTNVAREGFGQAVFVSEN